jgi:aldehyde:ferredoxin oxidoreductase
MKLFDNFYNMKVGIVDLSELSSEVIALDDHLIAEKIGGAAVNAELFKHYEDGDPLILGVGPLTGSFAPASCLSVATFLSPRFGTLCHVPLMIRNGPEMKFSGIDFLVIKGIASSPKILHLDKGVIQVLSAEHLVDLAVPEALQVVKRESSPYRSIILTGPAADHGVSCVSVSTGLYGSLDKAGLAFLMASKNLKGIIFNGIDGLPFAEDNVHHKERIEKKLFADKVHKNEGFFSMLDMIGIEKNLKGIIKKAKWRNVACYHCPSPCMSSVEYRWYDPRKHAKAEDTIFLSDHLGFLALARRGGANVLPLLKSCFLFGLDPVAVAEILPENGSLLESLNAIEEISASLQGPDIKSESPQIKAVSGKIHNLFGGGIPTILDSELWEKRVYLSMVLGVCPLFLLHFPQISDSDLLGFLAENEHDLNSLGEILGYSTN